MKKIFTLFLLTGLLFQAKAQTANAVVYSEMGEKFTLYLNSEPQNDQPQSNVKVKGLTAEYYQARIDFEDAKLADFANNNFAVQKGLEVTYIVKKNKKGEYVLRYHGESPISGSAAAATPAPVNEDAKRIADVHTEDVVIEEIQPSDVEVVETIDQDGENIDMQISMSAPQTEEVKVKTNVGATTTTKTTTTTTSKPATSKPATTNTENVSMGVNVGGVNLGVNFKVEETTSGGDVNMDMNVEESATQTTTTTRTTTGTQAPPKTTAPVKPATPTKPATTSQPKAPAREEVVVVGGVAGCTIPMNSTDFAKAKSTIAGKNFEEQKLSTAKTIAKANCLSAEQIKDICSAFNFEDSKLDFAKYAYDYCSDKGNYYVINDVFNFSSSSDELEQYISTK